MALDKSIAGAVGCGLDPLERRVHMVVDVGGGTAEVVAFCFGGVLAHRSTKLAGEEMTLAVSRYLRETHHLHVGELEAESLKIRSSGADDGPLVVQGRDAVSGRPLLATVKAAEVTDAVRPITDEILRTLAACLDDLPPQALSDVLAEGVVVFGGSSQIQGFAQELEKSLGLPVKLAEQPDDLRGRGRRPRAAQPPAAHGLRADADRHGACTCTGPVARMSGTVVDVVAQTVGRHARRAVPARTRPLHPGRHHDLGGVHRGDGGDPVVVLAVGEAAVLRRAGLRADRQGQAGQAGRGAAGHGGAHPVADRAQLRGEGQRRRGRPGERGVGALLGRDREAEARGHQIAGGDGGGPPGVLQGGDLQLALADAQDDGRPAVPGPPLRLDRRPGCRGTRRTPREGRCRCAAPPRAPGRCR